MDITKRTPTGRKNVPKELERKLAKRAVSKGLKGKRKQAYIYGTLRKTGWVPRNQK